MPVKDFEANSIDLLSKQHFSAADRSKTVETLRGGTMRKPKISQREQERRSRQSAAAIEQGLPQIERRWVTGPTLRKNLNISPPTLWRWRHNPNMAFPTATLINGRLYFCWDDVQAWIAKQQQAA